MSHCRRNGIPLLQWMHPRVHLSILFQIKPHSWDFSGLFCLFPKPGYLLTGIWNESQSWEAQLKVKGLLLCHSGSWGKSISFEFSQLEMFRNAWSEQHIEVGSSQWIWISLVSGVGRLTPLFVSLSKYEPSASGDILSPPPLLLCLFRSLCHFIPSLVPLPLFNFLSSLSPLLVILVSC